MRDAAAKRAASRDDPIEVDSDETASEADDEQQNQTITRPKRKFKDIDVWGDEPDEVEEYKKREKENKRLARGGKRQPRGAARGRGQGKGRTQGTSNHRTRDALREAVDIADDDEEDEYVDILVPPHIAQRRSEFDENFKELSESGLKLPPKYDDLYFSDDERDILELEERPKFDAIKPCRAYRDLRL